MERWEGGEVPMGSETGTLPTQLDNSAGSKRTESTYCVEHVYTSTCT